MGQNVIYQLLGIQCGLILHEFTLYDILAVMLCAIAELYTIMKTSLSVANLGECCWKPTVSVATMKTTYIRACICPSL